MSFKEKPFRSATKMISWRFFATLTTMILVYSFTGNLTLSFGVGLIEVIAKMVLYYFHERFWNALNWGRYPLEKVEANIEINDRDRENKK